MIAPRPRLAARLEEAVAASRITLVQGPAGSGKTSLVDWWCRDDAAVSTSSGRRRLDASTGVDADTVMAAMPPEFLDPRDARSGRRSQPKLTPVRPTIVVLDDCPRSSAKLTDDLGRLLHRTRADVRYVLVGRRPLGLDLHALGAAGEVLPITAAELDLDDAGIARVLTRSWVDPSDDLVAAVRRCTEGWTCGVQIAAQALRRCASVEEALRETDRAVSALMWTTALAQITPETLRLLINTSMLPEVSPDLAAAVNGDSVEAVVDGLDVPSGFVDQDIDGTFRCHPLLRRILLRRLSRTPTIRRQATQRAARRLRESGAASHGLDLAAQAEDWEWVGHELVELLQVPRLLIGGSDQPLGGGHRLASTAAAVPLVRAAIAVRRGWPDHAESALAEMSGPSATDISTAEQVSTALTRMVGAVQQGRRAEGVHWLARVDQLTPRLSLSQRAAAPELEPLVQSGRGMLDLWDAAPEHARRAWESGARGLRPGTSHSRLPAQLAAVDCLGQLAFLEAVAGETNRALRHVGDVLAAGAVGRTRSGTLFAHLAAAWAQINGGEVAAAGERLDTVVERCREFVDAVVPAGLAAALAVVDARLGAVARSGLVSGHLPPLGGGPLVSGWFAQLLVTVRAEAELMVGEPASALRALTSPGLTDADAQVMRALALLQLGDLDAATACLRNRRVDTVTTLTQVQIELIEARLTLPGDRDRARTLINRALCTAQREMLRLPVAWAKSWLAPVVVADPSLLHRYGAFLASIRPAPTAAPPSAPGLPSAGSASSDTSVLAEPLTGRELDVLQQLASMSSNAEIAADLFLSVNTVKTHLSAAYRKLGVNRRSAAVRRGRELGLC